MRYAESALGPLVRPWQRAIGSAGERLVHTEEVTGSIPVSPTKRQQLRIGADKISSEPRSLVDHAGSHGCWGRVDADGHHSEQTVASGEVVYFDHRRSDCKHRYHCRCAGRWRREISLGMDGQGQTEAAVRHDLDQTVTGERGQPFGAWPRSSGFETEFNVELGDSQIMRLRRQVGLAGDPQRSAPACRGGVGCTVDLAVLAGLGGDQSDPDRVRRAGGAGSSFAAGARPGRWAAIRAGRPLRARGRAAGHGRRPAHAQRRTRRPAAWACRAIWAGANSATGGVRRATRAGRVTLGLPGDPGLAGPPWAGRLTESPIGRTELTGVRASQCRAPILTAKRAPILAASLRRRQCDARTQACGNRRTRGSRPEWPADWHHERADPRPSQPVGERGRRASTAEAGQYQG